MDSFPGPPMRSVLTKRGPLITIGLPVRNGEPFLADALASILQQTFQNFQLVISDNASDDGTEAICRDYAAADHRIVYHQQDTNIGAAGNYNFLFGIAETPYFKWAAHDDVLDPSFLETCVEALEGDPTAVLAYPKTILIDAKGEAIRNFEDGLHLVAAEPHVRLFQLVTAYGLSNAIFGLIRCEALRHTRLIRTFRGSDYVLLVELALLGKFIEIPQYLFFRRRHVGSSVVANVNSRSVGRWFDPNVDGRDRFINGRLFLEHLGAVRRMGFPMWERQLCYVQSLVWLGQRVRDRAGRHKANVKEWLSGKRRLLRVID